MSIIISTYYLKIIRAWLPLWKPDVTIQSEMFIWNKNKNEKGELFAGLSFTFHILP
jgi:hypothetical protein